MPAEPRHPIIINWKAAGAAALIGGISIAVICLIIGAGTSTIIAASIAMTVFCGMAGALEQ